MEARHLRDSADVGARRPCTALLRQRVRKPNARNVMAQAFAAQHNGASPNFTARNGVGVGEDAVKNVSSGMTDLLEVQRRRVRLHRLCRRQAPLHGVSGATHPQILCLQRHCASIHCLT